MRLLVLLFLLSTANAFAFEGIQRDGRTRCRLETLRDRFVAKYYVDFGHTDLIPFETGFLFKDMLNVKGGLVSVKSSYKMMIEYSEGEPLSYEVTLPREGNYQTIHCLRID